MAETKKIVWEGDVTLAYFADERDSKHVLIKPEDTSEERPTAVGDEGGERLETKIARELGFPNDDEFNAIFKKLEDMREAGSRPAEGVPTGTRETKLRITIEVL